MNAVEIEEAVSDLVAQPFAPAEFSFHFITAFGAKKATVDRLRKGDTNQSDVGGMLQRSNIHIGIAAAGDVGATLAALRTSPKTASAKAKFILATDGETVEAEDLVGGDVIACTWADLPRHFATFLPLAGISTVKEIKNNPIDVKATGRLNKLYVELLKDNPGWATEERRHELNQFMARLIFCFFAEDTGIFRENQFTATITQMSQAGHGSGDEQWGNTHDVLTELFRAMDTPVTHEGNLDPRYRIAAAIRPYADVFPYVNGGLFTGATDSPRFSRTARAYLLRTGELDWKEINPDIFGSMIQAVADDGERGELGMHYTSVPNILKVLNPLFLDDLRGALEAAGDSKQKLRNLRKRLGGIRVFDPACGSGNFLVIAYKEMRAIEAAIVAKLGGEESLKLADRRSVIPLSNFYGIEIKGFAAEIARLALLIAEFQADCLYLSQQEARAMVLPLHATGQIHIGNALRLEWQNICPIDLAHGHVESVIPSDERVDTGDSFAANGGLSETYICGNPPYAGFNAQTGEQLDDLKASISFTKDLKYFDYVSGWIAKATDLLEYFTAAAFVATNSICQGVQVPILWRPVFQNGVEIFFAYKDFAWTNNAANNAGVICVIVGLTKRVAGQKYLYDGNQKRECRNINGYLADFNNVFVDRTQSPISELSPISTGNVAYDGGNLIISDEEKNVIISNDGFLEQFIRPLTGSKEFIRGEKRFCIWLNETNWQEACERSSEIRERVSQVRLSRIAGGKIASAYKDVPYRFYMTNQCNNIQILVPRVSSYNREFIPAGIFPKEYIISDSAQAIFDCPLWTLSILVSSLHMAWIRAVSGKLKNDIRYSAIICYNTFPVPKLTEQEKLMLARTAENILLAREAHFPATIANLYDPEAMPDDLRRAHEENDEVLERIYIGRRFRNDTERLEKLFDLYTKMTANAPKPTKGKKAA